MHEGEADIDVALVEALIAEQFPALADLAVRDIGSTGTVNAIYRLGDDRCVRLPRLKDAPDCERTWLPRLAPHLTVPIPERLAHGKPGCGYPFRWAIYRWIQGTPYEPAREPAAPTDDRRLATDLATFVRELRTVDTAGAPPAGRGPLAELDDATRAAIHACGDAIDRAEAAAAWDRALDAPIWDGERVWIHNDLLPTNLLIHPEPAALAPDPVARSTRSGASSTLPTVPPPTSPSRAAPPRLTAVIDFGGCGAGDPAADVVPAWSVFGPTGREAYRAALGPADADAATWERARGYALHQTALIIPYYAATNPAMVTMALRTVEHVLADTG